MRTKDEAAANPLAGDRWEKRGGIAVIDGKGGFMWEGPARFAPPMTAWGQPWLPAFQRWCRDAEYLGGAE